MSFYAVAPPHRHPSDLNRGKAGCLQPIQQSNWSAVDDCRPMGMTPLIQAHGRSPTAFTSEAASQSYQRLRRSSLARACTAVCDTSLGRTISSVTLTVHTRRALARQNKKHRLFRSGAFLDAYVRREAYTPAFRAMQYEEKGRHCP